MKHLFRLWLCILCAVSTFGCEVKHDLYDLKFEQVSSLHPSWNMYVSPIGGKGRADLYKDTITPISEKHSGISFRSSKLGRGKATLYYPFYASLNQQIFIPDESRQIAITISSKGTNIEKAWLNIVSCDIREQVLRIDSVALPVGEKWQESTLAIASENTHFLRIEIEAAGEKNPDAHRWEKESRFHIRQMQLLIDRKELEIKKSFRPIPPLHAAPGTYPDHLPDSIVRKKIIALGETLSGDSLIAEAEWQMLRRLVTKEDCRLILSDVSGSQAFLWNLFIHSTPHITWEDIVTTTESTYLQTNPTVFKRMLYFLRSHNQETSRKVYLAGIGSFSPTSPRHLLRIFKAMYNESDTTVLLDFTRKLRKDSIQEAFGLLEGLDTKKSVDPLNTLIFSTMLRQMRNQTELWTKPTLPLDEGDVMAKNAAFLIDSLSGVLGQTLIISHWEHVNKIDKTTPYMKKSFGAHLKQKYGTDYYVIGILRGSGEYLGLSPDHEKREFGLQRFPLSLPENPLFLENYCSKHLKTNTFYAFSKEDRFVCWIREAGASNRIFLKPIAPAERMDAFLWIE